MKVYNPIGFGAGLFMIIWCCSISFVGITYWGAPIVSLIPIGGFVAVGVFCVILSLTRDNDSEPSNANQQKVES